MHGLTRRSSLTPIYLFSVFTTHTARTRAPDTSGHRQEAQTSMLFYQQARRETRKALGNCFDSNDEYKIWKVEPWR